MALASPKEKEVIHILSLLALNPQSANELFAAFERLSESEREEFYSLADSNHVVLRALEPLHQVAASRAAANSANGVATYVALAEWTGTQIERERSRVARALASLHKICSELEAAGCATSVMKSLDHYPDLGSDLDLYTTADEGAVAEVMTKRFQAHIEARSWGDRLAHKWNFGVPGLPEPIEVHAQRLG